MITILDPSTKSHLFDLYTFIDSSGWRQCLDAAARVSGADGAGHDASAESPADTQDAHSCVP